MGPYWRADRVKRHRKHVRDEVYWHNIAVQYVSTKISYPKSLHSNWSATVRSHSKPINFVFSSYKSWGLRYGIFFDTYCTYYGESFRFLGHSRICSKVCTVIHDYAFFTVNLEEKRGNSDQRLISFTSPRDSIVSDW